MGFYVVVGLTKLMSKSWTSSDCILRLVSKVIMTDVQPLNSIRNLILGWSQSCSTFILMYSEELNS